MKKYFIYLCSLMSLVGCSQNETINNEIQSEGVSFTTSIGASRATDISFEAGDAISVFGVEEGENPVSSENVKYVYNNGFVAAGVPLYYPEDESPLSFCAIYPYDESIDYVYDFSVKLDQSASDNYTKSDLMVAKTGLTTDLQPHLQFRHRLSSVLIGIENKLENFEIESVELNQVATSLRYDVEDDNIISTDDIDNLTMKAKDGYYTVIFPPQRVETTNPFIVVNGKNAETGESLSFSWRLSKDTNFKAGIRHQYQLYITSRGIMIEDKGTPLFESDILPWIEPEDIEAVVTPEILDSLEKYMPIYRGDTPPFVEGAYLLEPCEVVYCQDYETGGGFAPGHIFASEQIRFFNQDNEKLTLDFEGKTLNGTSFEEGTGSFICGSGNNFTVYFDTEGYASGIYNRMAEVYSGTLTEEGISNLYFAYVMVEKGEDPNNLLMGEGVFRLVKDGDGIASVYPWDGEGSRATKSDLYTILKNARNVNK